MKVTTLISTALLSLASANPLYHKRAAGLAVELTQASDTEVKATLTNTGADAINLLTYSSLLDNAPVYKLNVMNNGQPVPFTGVLMHYSFQSLPSEAFVSLAPGASAEAVINVASLYDIPGGSYTISAVDQIAYAPAGSTEITGIIAYESNTINLEISSEAASKVTPAIKPLAKRTQVSGCSGSQGTALNNAIASARTLASGAAQAASSGSSSKFQEYFRTTSSSARSAVAARLNAISRESSSTTSGATQYYCTDVLGGCSSGVIAYTSPSQNIIANCNLFYSLPARSRACDDQSQASTVLHEMTHAPGIYSPGTQDYAYGYSSSTSLSSSQALNNADSFALYADAISLGC